MENQHAIVLSCTLEPFCWLAYGSLLYCTVDDSNSMAAGVHWPPEESLPNTRAVQIFFRFDLRDDPMCTAVFSVLYVGCGNGPTRLSRLESQIPMFLGQVELDSINATPCMGFIGFGF